MNRPLVSNDQEAAKIIKATCKIKQLTAFHSLILEKQAVYIAAIHKKGCSIRQIERLTGVSKAHIERTLQDE